MKKVLFSLVLVLISLFGYGQTLIAGWDFQTGPGTVIVATPNTQTAFSANVGSGNIYLNGINGSSSWTSASELNSFGGTALNAGAGMSTTTSGAASLALVGGTGTSPNFSANGKSIVFSVDMSNYKNLIITYATQRTTTGFTSHTWEYSTNGSTWASINTISSLPTNFAVQTLPTVTGLDNISTAYVRLTVNGATNNTGNNRLDNIQFNATLSPLPITLISFKASLNSSNQAVLKWATASEKDNHYFEIERSKNAIDFESLGKMNGKGTSDLRNDYAFTDETPLKGINYYRLKQVDFDGTFSYTRPESVITEGDGSISLYPNPTANVLKINFEDLDQIETTTIYNQSGVVMKNLQGSKSSIDIQELPQGKYILQIRLADQRIITNSFVKF